MKLVKQISLTGMSLLLVVSLAACGAPQKSGAKEAQQVSTTQTETASTQTDTKSTQAEVTMTLDELKKYDGQNGNPAYVAVDGVIYDVTNANNWHNGKHKNGITAGQDLSEQINQSPHGKAVLEKLPVIGKISK